jgi:predicted PurR-regulated permease PerM
VLIVALLVAGTLSPAVRWLEEKRVRRGFGIAIVFTVFFILALLVVFLTIPTLVSQAVALLENEPALRVRLADYLGGSPLSAPVATWIRGLKADALTDAFGGTAIESGNANGHEKSTTPVDNKRGKQ